MLMKVRRLLPVGVQVAVHEAAMVVLVYVKAA
jgi:hypothetical protein